MASQYKQRVGRNIKKYRLESDQTILQIANKVGITESTMQKYEAGNIARVDVEMLEKIADAIGCDAHDLVEWRKGEHETYNDNVKANRLAKHDKLFEQLTLENQKQVNDYINFLLNQQKFQNTHIDSNKSN